MDGGAGRVLAAGDRPTRPTTRVAKDVWVVGGTASVRPPWRVVQPQVDFRTSVPTRAAEALYWMGRAVERAEVVARTVRVVGNQVQQDDSLLQFGGGWATGSVAMLRAAQGRPADTSGAGFVWSVSLAERLESELRGGRSVVAAQVGSLVQEAASVREFLSTTTGRVLGRLARAGFSDVSTPIVAVLSARYVSGYIATEPSPGFDKLVRTDASHAWCSAWTPDRGWIDADPTNDQVPPRRHVTVAWGATTSTSRQCVESSSVHRLRKPSRSRSR